jgi:hypothetical protein
VVRRQARFAVRRGGRPGAIVGVVLASPVASTSARQSVVQVVTITSASGYVGRSCRVEIMRVRNPVIGVPAHPVSMQRLTRSPVPVALPSWNPQCPVVLPPPVVRDRVGWRDHVVMTMDMRVMRVSVPRVR